MKRISFDFDGCLKSNKLIQLICKLFISSGYDVYILTSRNPLLPNIDLFEMSDRFGISRENIIMTNGSLKLDSFMKNRIDIHFDNSFDEVVAINDMFIGNNPMKKYEDMPAILTNIDSEEIQLINNILKDV